MKILLAHKFYYRRGGDAVYTLGLAELLSEHGHNTAVFSMQFPENLPTKWERFFPSEVRMRVGMGLVKTLRRPFGTNEVRDKFSALLNKFKPDVVHLNNIHTQLSPLIGEIAHKRGIKVVWTLHDYKLLCPRYDCLRNGESICEECFSDKRNVLRHKCMKNSLLASVIAYREALTWNRERLEACTDTFICPSQFMAQKMAQGGFNIHKLVTSCNFIDIEKCNRDNYKKDDYFCYVGRLSHEKGVATLIRVANEMKERLVVVGGGPLEAELKAMAGKNVEFTGFRQWDDVKEIVGQARFTVVPSEWYENNPLSIIEALCLGTPVLGARIGGIPELIKDGQNGMTFESGNTDDLKAKLQRMLTTMFDYEKIAHEACETYNAESYYKRIMDIYPK